MKVSKKNTDFARETRLWLKEIALPCAMLVAGVYIAVTNKKKQDDETYRPVYDRDENGPYIYWKKR